MFFKIWRKNLKIQKWSSEIMSRLQKFSENNFKWWGLWCWTNHVHISSGYENIFINLEEIELLNYKTYLERVLKEEDKEDINKLKKEIYWNTSFNKLSLFKNLKNIKIDDGKYENLIELGLDKFFNNSKSISLNGYKNFNEEYFKKIKTLNFFYNSSDKKHNIFSKIKPERLNQYQNIINDKFCLNINEYEYYTNPYKYYLKIFWVKNLKLF